MQELESKERLPLVFTWEHQFRHPAARVWPLLSDTDRGNWAVGNPPVDYVDTPAEHGGSVRHGSYSILGFAMSWLEPPYEWIEGRGLHVERLFDRGPMAKMFIDWDLEPQGERCLAKQRVSIAAALKPLVPVIRMQVGWTLRRNFLRLFTQIDDFLDRSTPVPFHIGFAEFDAAAPQTHLLVERFIKAGVEPQLAERMASYVLTGSPLDVVRIRPFRLARQWGTPRKETLHAFLLAARAGLLDVSWDLLCPSCGGDKEKVATLGKLPNAAHCGSCNIRFDASFDDSVELSFAASAALRGVTVGRYCVGGPQNTPQRTMQVRLAQGGSRNLTVELEAGTYLLRSLQSPSLQQLEVGDGGSREVELRFAPQAAGDTRLQVAAGPVTFALANACDWEVVAEVQRARWLEDVCTAAYVTTLQEFRDLFSSEVLRPGQEIAVRSVALLFTDLKGSTSMYARIGDATAFSMVRDHFDVLLACVRAHDGAIVKTIGDAVMAAFAKPVDALRAAIDMHRGLRGNAAAAERLTLKIGVHAGPCYVVNLNDRLDYFGTNVNIAARSEGQCSGDDIVMTQSTYEDTAVRRLLDHQQQPIERLSRTLKGFDKEFTLYRVDCREQQKSTAEIAEAAESA